ncbi:MAG: DNA polymerase III subunit gamma/tau [Balneolaceae bacterium]
MPDHYRALTRTYRPASFDDIVSQEHVSSTLKNAIKQNRLSHAYMFCGPRGVGKTTMARVLARTINAIGADVDGEALNQTLNVIEIDAASNNKVDDIHHLRESVRIPPQNGRYKVFIIDEVHMLSKAAFNALLKTLEEPPAHAIFIFATTEPHKVLPTILSRVQRFDFKRISVDEIVDRLRIITQKENITIDDESLHVIAKKADGALRDALGLMDQAIAFCGDTIRHDELLKALNVVGVERLFAFSDVLLQKDSTRCLQMVHELLAEGADIQEFLVELAEHFRNLYVAIHTNRMQLVDATAETKERYKAVAQHFTEEDMLRMLHLVSEAQRTIRDVQQPKVHFELLMLKLIHMHRTPQLESLLSELQQVKKKRLLKADSAADQHAESREPEPSIQSDSRAYEPDEPDSDESKSEASARPEVNDEPGPPSSGKAPSAPVASPTDSGHAQKQTAAVDEDDFLAIKPTLGFAKGISTHAAEDKDPHHQEEEETAKEPVSSIRSVEDVESCWEMFLDVVQKEAPQVLFFQMQRVQLRDVNGHEVTVVTENEFATNLLHENNQLLGSLFKQVSGTAVRFRCHVQNNGSAPKTLSPFERFKELQRKDPILKDIVEKLGAELEY